MTIETHRIINHTKGRLLSEGVHAVDATFEHLTVLRVLIEGLAENHEAGLWLTEVRGIPTVPRISPLDLIYVDREQRVVEAVELLPAGEQPPFREPAVSALVLPFRTITATETRVGDQLIIDGAAGRSHASAAEATVRRSNSVAERLFAAMASVQVDEQPAMRMPAATPFAPPAAEAAASAPLAAEPEPAPMLTVQEAMLPQPEEPAEELHEPQEPQHAQAAHASGKARLGKRQKTPHNRKARRQAAIAQRNREAVAAIRQRREELQSSPQPAGSVVSMPSAAMRYASQAAKGGASSPHVAAQPGAALWRSPIRLLRRAKDGLYSFLGFDLLIEALRAVNGNERGTFMAIVNRVLHWLNPNAVNEEQRASIRRPANELVAYTGDAGQEKKLDVGDISSSGLFLRTDERWELGKQVSLSLQQNGPVSEIPDRHAEVEASTVRHAKDGMGLAFLLPPETSLDLWESAVSGQTTQTGPDYIVHEMRMAQATGVLRRICPEIVEEARQKLRKDFSSVRVRDAIRIILMADQMLRSNYNDRYLKAPAALVAQIIEMGSWASEEWQQQQWAGLLATSCSRDGNDLSNAELINLLGQLAHVHVRILETACSQQADSPGSHADPPSIAIQDLARLQDLSNMTRLLRAVAEMVEHRLLSPLKRSLTDAQDESSTVTVTPLGMRMFARCHGRRDH